MKFPRINVNDKTVNLELTTTHAKVSHLVASLPTSCVRTACPKLSTSLEQIQGRRNWGAGRAAASVAIARRRTPHTPIIQSIENMIRRSSTPDVSQTSLSIYQFKSALSRKSVPPLPSHRSGVPEQTVNNLQQAY